MEQVLEDLITLDGARRLKVVSDRRLTDLSVPDYAKDCKNVRTWQDADLGLHYLEMTYPYRGPAEVLLECWPKKRRMVIWALLGQRVSRAMQEAAIMYASTFARWPGYAFIRKLPRKVENGVEVDGVMLLQTEWALPGVLMVGG